MPSLFECPIQCGRRHKEGHPHLELSATDVEPETPFSGVPSRVSVQDESSAPSNAVTGAQTPEQLAEQARAATATKTKGAPVIKSKQEREAEEREMRIAAMRPLAREIATAPYDTMALMTMDERWNTFADQKILALEQATLNAMLAWGIEFAGKYSSLTALLVLHGKTMTAKYTQIQKEEAQKRESEARNAVTQ